MNGEPIRPQPKGRYRVFEKQEIRRDAEALERAVRLAVNVRDKRRCRCCGRSERLHLHHLTFRSKGGQWSTENLVTLDDRCHSMLHARQLWIFGKNADTRLTFEIHEAAVVDLFGVRPLPPHVKITTDRRR